MNALLANPPGAVDENEFIDASRQVYDGVREIRRAVLLNRGEEDIDSDTEWDDMDDQSEIGSQRPLVESRQEEIVDEFPHISGITTAREAMKKLPEDEKVKIQAQVEEFRTEQMKFDREVSKWDDNGNDVIVLAKHMCMIMMEMTDFTRGKGRLKTTMDVITAAKGISENGTKLDKLARSCVLCTVSSLRRINSSLLTMFIFCSGRSPTSAPSRLPRRTCWPISRGSPSTVTSSTSPPRSRPTSRTCPGSSSCPDSTLPLPSYR